jgi:hypothetical protein
MHMISAPEAARYPFFAALSGCRNGMGSSIAFDFLARAPRVERTNIPQEISRGSRAAQRVVPVLLEHRSGQAR